MAYHEHRYRFPLAGLALALTALDALRASGLMSDAAPANMLGDPLDSSGQPCQEDHAVFRGGVSGGWVYLNVLSRVAPGALPDMTAYGMEPTDAAASAAVLGVWA